MVPGQMGKGMFSNKQFFRQLLQPNGLDAALEALWGRSIRGYQPGHPNSSSVQSIQMHATVQQDSLTELLQCSGFNRLYATPKAEDGRISTAEGGVDRGFDGSPYVDCNQDQKM